MITSHLKREKMDRQEVVRLFGKSVLPKIEKLEKEMKKRESFQELNYYKIVHPKNNHIILSNKSNDDLLFKENR